MDPEKPDTAAQEVLAEAQRISPNPTESNQKTEAKIEAAISQDSEDALLEEEVGIIDTASSDQDSQTTSAKTKAIRYFEKRRTRQG